MNLFHTVGANRNILLKMPSLHDHILSSGALFMETLTCKDAHSFKKFPLRQDRQKS